MKTQLSKPSRGKARYTEEYKQEALELWRNSGCSAAKVALARRLREETGGQLKMDRREFLHGHLDAYIKAALQLRSLKSINTWL